MKYIFGNAILCSVKICEYVLNGTKQQDGNNKNKISTIMSGQKRNDGGYYIVLICVQAQTMVYRSVVQVIILLYQYFVIPISEHLPGQCYYVVFIESVNFLFCDMCQDKTK